MIKCVVWDIDHTLLTGVYLESADRPPPPDGGMVAVARELSGRGILHALASRNPPEAARYVREATGLDFAAEQLRWDSKADAVERIAGELAIGTAEIAFVDDDMLDRAEVSAALPEVMVLTPEDAAQATGWPEFRPAVVTAEASRRAQMYQARRRRQAEAASFGGSREEFLRHVGTRATIAWAVPADVPRLHELSVRTHQLNSAGTVLSQSQLATLLASGGQFVVTVALADDFGDDGIVGGAVIDGNVPSRWRVPALMMSCRALGRGVLDALLAWICLAGARAGATELSVPCLVTERNVPMRLALTAAGLRADQQAGGFGPAGSEVSPGGPVSPRASTGESGSALFTRSLGAGLPELPDWVSVPVTPP